jgi:hypothetical protein
MTNKKAWDIDAEVMNTNLATSAKEEEGELIEKEPMEANIKRPTHKNPILKMAVLFAGGTGAIAFVCLAFFGGAFESKPQVAAVAPTPAPSALTTSEQEQLANAQAALAMGGSEKAFESHKQQGGKKETTPTTSPSPENKPAPKTAPEAPKTPEVATAKPAPKTTAPTMTPVVYRQAQPQVAAQPRSIATPQYQATRIAANSGQSAEIKELKAQIDKLTKAIKAQKQERNQIAMASKPAPTTVASTPPAAKVAPSPTPAPTPKTEPVTVAEQPDPTIPAIDSSASAKLLDAITIAAGNSSTNGNSQVQTLVRIQLSQAIPTNKGMLIPDGATIAMNVRVASNGLVEGDSVGVWDTRTGQKLDIPDGALVIRGKKDEPLIAQTIKPSDTEAQGADTEAAIWKAVGGGVEGLTRPDSNTSVSTGAIITTSTNGGSRDFLVNAAGGFAKQKASSMEKQAAADRDRINGQAALWHLPKGAEIMVSARPLVPVQSAKYAQMGTSQLDPASTRYAISSRQNLIN